MSEPLRELLAIEGLLKWSSPDTTLSLQWYASAGGIYWSMKLQDGRELSGCHGTLRGLFEHIAIELKYPYLSLF